MPHRELLSGPPAEYLEFSEHHPVFAHSRVPLCILALLVVLAQSGCGLKPRAEARREAFLDRLSKTEDEAERTVNGNLTGFARFLAQEILVSAAEIKEKELWAQGAGYIVFHRDDFMLIRGQWISDRPDGETVVLTRDGAYVETFDLLEADLDNNQVVPRTRNGRIGSARFEFGIHIQYGSELATQVLDGANTQSLEFSVRHNDEEVAVVKHGAVFDSRD